MGSGKVTSGRTPVANLSHSPRLQETERSLRLRNNKRRHRARQKEYTADLESKLTELQQQGVQATIEIQRSARKVANENHRLRALLRHVGVDGKTIIRWAAEKGGEGDEEVGCRRTKVCLRKVAGATVDQVDLSTENSPNEEHNAPGAIIASTSPLEQQHLRFPLLAQTPPEYSNSSVGDGFHQIPNEPSTLAGNRSPVDSILPISDPGRGPGNSETNDSCRRSSVGRASSPEKTFTSILPAPCKLLTHLAAHPNADVTQMPTASDEEEPNLNEADDGVPCSRAYRMLMCYATTGPKLDAVTHVLEEGCVPTAGPGKGCKVRNKTIWKALDDICL